MNSEQYTNLISLLQKALEFYANHDNYIANQFINGEAYSKIEIDDGSQANFTLKRVEETLEADKKLQEDYNRVINETIEAIENHPIDLTTIINSYKNAENGRQNV